MIAVTEAQTALAGELRGVDKWYEKHHVLTDVSLAVNLGEIVALIGRSGSGKSTVLRVFAGLSKDHTGQRTVAGSPALAFQEPRLFPWRDVRTNVSYGLNRSGLGKEEARSRADSALADVELADRATVWPATLSGGQAQRVSLARALVAEPELLLLDLWRRRRFGVLLVTHDVDEAIALADRVLVLDEGRVVYALTIDEPRPPAGEAIAESEHYRAVVLDKLGVRI